MSELAGRQVPFGQKMWYDSLTIRSFIVMILVLGYGVYSGQLTYTDALMYLSVGGQFMGVRKSKGDVLFRKP